VPNAFINTNPVKSVRNLRPAGIAFFLAASLCAQSIPTFRAETRLVRVDAEVLEDGRVLNGLGRDDLQVLDEGKPQTVRHFSAGEDPLDLILLFDVSGSMGLVIAAVAAAAREGLQELRAGDRVCIMTFNTKSQEVAGFTENLDAVQKTIEEDVLRRRFGGGTLIQASVDDAALRFLREPKSERRRAVLIITDNMGVRTRREQSVVKDFWEADALLSGLIVYNKRARTVHTIGLILAPDAMLIQAGMKGIAEKTGGDAISAEDAAKAFQESMRRIRTRYSLYYEQPEAKPGSRRSIRVELAGELARLHPKARVRARSGYVVPKS
jgi:Ca-activated chloride channel homolog